MKVKIFEKVDPEVTPNKKRILINNNKLKSKSLSYF